jgi:ATP-dependent protease HslVU (ClpYQ) peptidase subunit
MSVVIYDSQRGLMAADSRAYGGDAHPIGNKMKIHRIKSGPFEGCLLGVTSAVPGMAEEFRQWVTEGMNKEAFAPTTPDLDALLVNTDGEVYLFSDAYYPSGPLMGDVFTVGSGKKYALGAFHAGASASQAVEAAIACDTMCGGPVATLELHPRADPDQLPLDLPSPRVAE